LREILTRKVVRIPSAASRTREKPARIATQAKACLPEMLRIPKQAGFSEALRAGKQE